MRLFWAAIFAVLLCQAEDALLVITGIAAQKEAVGEIGKELVQVQSLLPVGASPETFSPSAKQLALCSEASIYIYMGTPMEKGLLPKLRKSFPQLEICDATRGMAYRMEDDEHHGKGGKDPHLWLSIANMKIHAENVAEALCAARPGKADALKANLKNYKQKLDGLNEEIHGILAPLKGRTVLVYHPAFGYLLDSVGMRQLAVEQHGKDASARHLAELRREAENIECKLIFVQPQSNPVAAAKAAEILHRKMKELSPIPENYSPGMLEIARTLRSAFEL